MIMDFYTNYVDNIIKLMELIGKNLGDTDQADVIRDEIESLYTGLTEKQKKYTEHLTGDLYSIYDRGMYFKVPDGKKQEYKDRFVQAEKENDWFNGLEILRYSLDYPDRYIALYRSKAWKGLGCPQVTLKFEQYAEKLKNK